MGLFRRKRRIKPKKFTPEELKRREMDIPREKEGVKKSPFEFVDEDSHLLNEVNKKPIPASIEYFSADNKQEKKKKKKDGEKVVKKKKEMPDFDKILLEQVSKAPVEKSEEEKLEEKTLEELNKKYGEKEIDFSKASLAEENDIDELEKKHMVFYSILSKIQDTHVASDFKSAYDIQDRISYLLNHKTLLYKSLVSELLIYLDSIIEKMEKYYADISEKQKKFNRYNRKVSELKRYKFKTDESIKIIDNSREEIEREMDIQKKNAEETP